MRLDMVEQQHDEDPFIQDFLTWQNSPVTWRTGAGGPKGETNPRYIPCAELQTYFDKPSRTRDLLRALFKDDDTPDADYVRKHYLRPFVILLSVKKGRMISHMIRHNSLMDQQLPFRTKPTNFPECSDCDLWAQFYKRQWKFCAVKMRYNMSVVLDQDEILPYRIEHKLGEGGSARIYKIAVDEGYNELDRSGAEKKASLCSILNLAS